VGFIVASLKVSRNSIKSSPFKKGSKATIGLLSDALTDNICKYGGSSHLGSCDENFIGVPQYFLNIVKRTSNFSLAWENGIG